MSATVPCCSYDRNRVEADTPVRVGVGLIVRNEHGDILLERRSESSEVRFFPLVGLPPDRDVAPPARVPLRDCAAGDRGRIR